MLLFIHLLVCVQHDSELIYGPPVSSSPRPAPSLLFVHSGVALQEPPGATAGSAVTFHVRADSNNSSVGVVRLLISDLN